MTALGKAKALISGSTSSGQTVKKVMLTCQARRLSDAGGMASLAGTRVLFSFNQNNQGQHRNHCVYGMNLRRERFVVEVQHAQRLVDRRGEGGVDHPVDVFVDQEPGVTACSHTHARPWGGQGGHKAVV